MIRGFINPLHVDQIVNDLGGYESVADTREGVLLDSMLFYTPGGVVALMEHPTGCDRSVYRVEMAPEGSKEQTRLNAISQ